MKRAVILKTFEDSLAKRLPATEQPLISVLSRQLKTVMEMYIGQPNDPDEIGPQSKDMIAEQYGDSLDAIKSLGAKKKVQAAPGLPSTNILLTNNAVQVAKDVFNGIDFAPASASASAAASVDSKSAAADKKNKPFK